MADSWPAVSINEGEDSHETVVLGEPGARLASGGPVPGGARCRAAGTGTRASAGARVGTRARVGIRAATAKLETDVVDVLAGQTYFLFGEGPFFFPMSIWFFGMPNQAFGRTQQLRFSKIIKSEPVNVDLGASISRPPQRDSEIP